MRSANVLTIAPGVPVLETFVTALLDGRIVEPTWADGDPLAFADLTIYVPTQRAAGELARALVRRLGRPSTLLPRIRPLGALDDMEALLLDDDATTADEGVPPLPAAVGEIERRMILTEVILAWSRALRHAVVRIGGDGRRYHDPTEACLVGTSALDAWHLAGALGRLIDELIVEDVGWSRLDVLALPAEFDDYWRITTDFLNIAITRWPDILAARGLVDPARRQTQIVAAQCARVAADTRCPVIALGSTGSHRATADLLRAIARAPRGAVVLPGLDLDLDDVSFATIGKAAALDTTAGHPQAALARLLRVMDVGRDDVVPLDAPTPIAAARRRFVSEALRPAETTDRWPDYRARTSAEMRKAALDGLSIVEAADEREEALALAVAMRESLETDGARAVLVTPDRGLGRRVQAELRRWNLYVADSAGCSLRALPAGRLAQQVLAAAAPDAEPAALAALLAHPAATFGWTRAEVEHVRSLLEIGVLRAGAPRSARATAPGWIDGARHLATTRGAHPAQRRMTTDDWAAAAALLTQVLERLAPLAALDGVHDIATWTAAHRAALAKIALSPAAAEADPDAVRLDDLLSETARCATTAMRFDAEGYAAFFATLADEVRVPSDDEEPRLKIFGLLEARLIDADLVLLGGLDETVWPPQAVADPFLNRPMRVALGLSAPERRIGQTAHDFAQALGAPRVVLSRARKRGGVPTVASRLVQRLEALAGEAFWTPVKARGEALLALARQLDDPPGPTVRLARPQPKPPVDLRPQRLSVTRIEMLRRDPYAVYAESILRLAEMPALSAGPSRRELGSAVHETIEDFSRRHPAGLVPVGARAELIAALETALAEWRGDPTFAAFEWPRLLGALDYFLRFDAARRAEAETIAVETHGLHRIALPDGSTFTLTAVADRIERRRDGAATLYDFKTGTLPGLRETFVGFAPQLTLEAAMLTRGAFGDPPGTAVEGASYIKLGGATGGLERPLVFDREQSSLAEVAERHYAGLLRLLAQFRDPETPYLARPFPKFAARFNVYDHLARTGEWSMGGEGEEA